MREGLYMDDWKDGELELRKEMSLLIGKKIVVIRWKDEEKGKGSMEDGSEVLEAKCRSWMEGWKNRNEKNMKKCWGKKGTKESIRKTCKTN